MKFFEYEGKRKAKTILKLRGDFRSKLLEEVAERFVGYKKKDEGEEEGVFRGELIIKKT